MYISSHISAGYIAGKLSGSRGLIMAAWLAGSLLPDIDGLWSNSVAGHHSFPHTPLFWFAVCAIAFVYGKVSGLRFISQVSVVLFLSTMIHLTTDWATARTVGIKWLSPLSDTDFSMLAIEPARGDIPIQDMLSSKYIYFYFENKFLAISELLLNFLALAILVKDFFVKRFKVRNSK